MLLLFLLNFAFAEYRAFELVISNQVTGAERVVLSNLDPDQYRGLYYVDPNEIITYRSTWRCKGNTSGEKICPQPENPSKGPDSNSGKP